MRSAKWKRRMVVQGLICAVGVGTAYADAPAPKWYDTYSVGGYIEGSYVGNLNDPSTKTNTDRIFDQESNSFNLNMFHLNFSKPMGDDNYAFTGKIHSGRDARVIKSAGTPSTPTNPDFDIEEAYVTVAVPKMKQLTFTGGKFVTLEGVEIIEAPANPNFSEGLLFGFAEPFTHTGLKANYAFNDKYNATVGVVNGWDTEADANDGKTIIWQTSANPIKMLTWTFEGSYGPEASTDNRSERTSLDTVVNANVTDKLSLWFQGNWGQDTNLVRSGSGVTNVVTGTGAIGPSTVRWSGLGTWAQYAVNSWLTEALRFEVFDDQGGANRLGNGVNETMKEFTWTNKFQIAKNVFTRLEYRHDWSNQGVFNLHAPGQTGTNQNTISMDYYVQF
jgi:putative OmpL-like beta-barrel porin-2